MEELKASHPEGPLVSVIVPVYNAGQFLGEALESLRSQSHARFEAILVDDGSTDDSATICRGYADRDPRFKLLSQENSGVSAARNAGIEAATGRWIAFLDADDLLYAESIRPMLDAAAATGAPVVAARYDTGVSPAKPRGNGRCRTLTADEAIAIGLYQKRILNNPWGMLFSSELFKEPDAPRFRPGRYEDLDLFYRVFERAGSIALLERTVYLYRDNPGSFINTWSAGRLDALDVTDRIVAHYRQRARHRPGKTSDRLLRAALDRRFSAHFNILLLMLRAGVDPPGQKERCLRVIHMERRRELADSATRLKNKIGALLSYGGLPLIRLLARFS